MGSEGGLTSLPTSQFRPPTSLDEPQIVLTWLLRLRWLAVVGQVLAVLVAVAVLDLEPPAWPVAGVIGATVLSQGVVRFWTRRRPDGAPPPGWLVPGILIFDVGLLTVLLYCTGGPENPFRVLYLVHVGMSVVALGFGWTWLIVGLAATCYGALYFWHLPLMPAGRVLPPLVRAVGDWSAVVLVSVLIAYFIGRVTRALRQRERELATARERAAKNEQLASLTTLAAGAAHELGSPLGTIAVVAKELQNDLDKLGRTEAAEDARLIRQEVDRCRSILDRMRVDILEEGHHERSPVTVAELVALVRQDLGGEHAAALRVEVSADAALPATPARAVRQALVVLLNNAFDASPGRQDAVMLRVGRVDGQVEFAVTDRGGGMAEDVLRRAGEPFFTTKPPGAGMGLGLFLVRLVAEKYGGSFRMSSVVGEGTRATLQLPDDVRPPSAAQGSAA